MKFKRSNQEVKLRRIGMLFQYNHKHAGTFLTIPLPLTLLPTPFFAIITCCVLTPTHCPVTGLPCDCWCPLRVELRLINYLSDNVERKISILKLLQIFNKCTGVPSLPLSALHLREGVFVLISNAPKLC